MSVGVSSESALERSARVWGEIQRAQPRNCDEHQLLKDFILCFQTNQFGYIWAYEFTIEDTVADKTTISCKPDLILWDGQNSYCVIEFKHVRKNVEHRRGRARDQATKSRAKLLELFKSQPGSPSAETVAAAICFNDPAKDNELILEWVEHPSAPVALVALCAHIQIGQETTAQVDSKTNSSRSPSKSATTRKSVVAAAFAGLTFGAAAAVGVLSTWFQPQLSFWQLHPWVTFMLGCLCGAVLLACIVGMCRHLPYSKMNRQMVMMTTLIVVVACGIGLYSVQHENFRLSGSYLRQ
eukprot:TRINITY_DN339_c0_g1_i1.p1 TRINITY_DN339_c0_g1~~TRINITY_DN339_c0_g1_i1.p1  ORF type:complete len:296 (+),score=21.21 TRINITY_DN339_c0_g1_i1:86-973(+)